MNLTVAQRLESMSRTLDDIQFTVDSLNEIRASLELSGEAPEALDNISFATAGLIERLATLRADISAAITANQAPELNLYRLTADHDDYYCFDSCVVAAESENAARLIYPDKYYSDKVWQSNELAIEQWAAPEDVQVELIGAAAPGIQKGVICASFNTG